MQPLADKALKAWQDGDVVFFPKSGNTPIAIGWKISGIGVSHASFGGDTAFRFSIA